MSQPRQDLCAAILAGGSSRRMGTNKALLRIDGVPLIERLLAEARLLTDEVWISANDPAPYLYLETPIIADRFPGQGPLAGLHAAFVASRRRYVLLLACDLPGVRAEWLASLLRFAAGCDAVIPTSTDGRPHPLCAVYERTCLDTVERNLGSGTSKMTSIFNGGSLRVRWLTGADGGFEDGDLRNLNFPADLRGPFPTSGG